ncbi:MAG TPA: hypothetical protein VNA25_04090 [Phycisphaerae bacterium]|nr:hypothetical protein [Phycisphaerae bacterium]
MKKTETKTETITRTRTYCDVCGRTTNRQCLLCCKDICDRCGVFSDDEYIDPLYGNSGDYPDLFCKPCFAVGAPMREKARGLNDSHYHTIEELGRQWREAAEAPQAPKGIDVQNPPEG